MNTKEYIALLKQYTQNTGVSIYDYYYQLAHFIKEADLESIPVWERHDPFLTKEDYQRLISCDEEDICRYFALAMEKTISLNLNAKEEKQENDIILENDENDPIKNENHNEEKVINLANEEYPRLTDGLTHNDIEDIVNDEMQNIPKDEFEGLSSNDIEEIINDEMLNIPREEDSSVMDGLSSEDIQEVVNDELEHQSFFKNIFVSISKKISNLLNGFALFKNEDKQSSDLYYFDAEKEELKGKQTFHYNTLKADTGIYVNYQEYLDQLLQSVLDQYPTAERITFIHEDNEEEKSFYSLADEAYTILKESGSIRFGDDFNQNIPETYQDFLQLEMEGTAPYAGEELRKGIYVRRDILDNIFSQYRMRAYVPEEENEFENKNVK